METNKSQVKVKETTFIPNQLAHLINDSRTDVISNAMEIFSGSALLFFFKFCAYLSDDQIHNKVDLDKFDNKWMSLDTESSQTFSFRYSNFTSSSNNNALKKSLKTLAATVIDIKSFYIDDTGVKIPTEITSAVISDLVFVDNKGFKFSMNYHWLRYFINLQNYKKILSDAIWKIKYKHTLKFYIWLSILKEINKFRFEEDKIEFESLAGKFTERLLGTSCKLQLLNNLLNINCRKPSAMITILNNIKQELDLYCDRSFNYSYNEHTQKFSIVSYELNKKSLKQGSDNNSIEIDPFTIDSIKIKKAITYRIKKQGLTATDALVLVNIYLKYSFDIVSKAISNKEVELYSTSGQYIVAQNTKVINTPNTVLEKKKVNSLEGSIYVDAVLKLCQDYCDKNYVIVEFKTYKRTKNYITFLESYLSKAKPENNS